jgi:hypothetical protein
MSVSQQKATKHLPCQKKADKKWPLRQTKEAMWRPMVVCVASKIQSVFCVSTTKATNNKQSGPGSKHVN